MNEKFAWTDDAVATLTRMWESGKTGSEIADEIGCARNAAIGKAHRLGLSKRRNPVDNGEDGIANAAIDLMIGSSGAVTLQAAARRCRVPITAVLRQWDKIEATHGGDPA